LTDQCAIRISRELRRRQDGQHLSLLEGLEPGLTIGPRSPADSTAAADSTRVVSGLHGLPAPTPTRREKFVEQSHLSSP
jgi:hypothetical protein